MFSSKRSEELYEWAETLKVLRKVKQKCNPLYPFSPFTSSSLARFSVSVVSRFLTKEVTLEEPKTVSKKAQSKSKRNLLKPDPAPSSSGSNSPNPSSLAIPEEEMPGRKSAPRSPRTSDDEESTSSEEDDKRSPDIRPGDGKKTLRFKGSCAFL